MAWDVEHALEAPFRDRHSAEVRSSESPRLTPDPGVVAVVRDVLTTYRETIGRGRVGGLMTLNSFSTRPYGGPENLPSSHCGNHAPFSANSGRHPIGRKKFPCAHQSAGLTAKLARIKSGSSGDTTS